MAKKIRVKADKRKTRKHTFGDSLYYKKKARKEKDPTEKARLKRAAKGTKIDEKTAKKKKKKNK